jgi:non-homologous end joining protein Ku
VASSDDGGSGEFLIRRPRFKRMLKSAIASSRVAAYPVIRDTIAKMNMVALGRVVLTRREHVIALEPRGLGLLGLTLRYPYEVRDEQPYF